MIPKQQWVFRGRITNVVDGDTVDAKIDIGFNTVRTERIRLLDCSAPERFTEQGKVVTKLVRAWVQIWNDMESKEWPLTIQTQKTDAFGRYLATIWNSDGETLNELVATWSQPSTNVSSTSSGTDS